MIHSSLVDVHPTNRSSSSSASSEGISLKVLSPKNGCSDADLSAWQQMLVVWPKHLQGLHQFSLAKLPPTVAVLNVSLCLEWRDF
jgi:hypothetical protein